MNVTISRCSLTALLIVVACATLSAQSPQAGRVWEVVKSLNGGTQVAGNALLSTVALSSTDAWAVGGKPNKSPALTTTLAEHWDGSRWSIVQTPRISTVTSQLNSLAAIDSKDVWAAGYADNISCFNGHAVCGHTLIDHWNGVSWTRVASPNPGIADYLYGIAAISATDLWAVGQEWISDSTWVPLLLHNNGKSWTPFDQSQLQFGQLSSVFAVAANDVWAVGWIGLGNAEGLALHWDGKSWTRMTFPVEPRGSTLLLSVSGIATGDIWAVGWLSFLDINGNQTDSARSYHWDGSQWNPVTVPIGGYSVLQSVSARATDDVWATGEGIVDFISQTYSHVTYHWDGSTWNNVPNPNRGVLNAISASPDSDVWAVGSGFVTPGTYTIHYVVP